MKEKHSVQNNTASYFDKPLSWGYQDVAFCIAKYKKSCICVRWEHLKWSDFAVKDNS